MDFGPVHSVQWKFACGWAATAVGAFVGGRATGAAVTGVAVGASVGGKVTGAEVGSSVITPPTTLPTCSGTNGSWSSSVHT